MALSELRKAISFEINEVVFCIHGPLRRLDSSLSLCSCVVTAKRNGRYQTLWMGDVVKSACCEGRITSVMFSSEILTVDELHCVYHLNTSFIAPADQ